jgi:hypothetical protein
LRFARRRAASEVEEVAGYLTTGWRLSGERIDARVIR